jgi:hypothetical protein
MGREGKGREEGDGNEEKAKARGAYLAHGCGFADGMTLDFDRRRDSLLSFRISYCLGGFFCGCFVLWRRSCGVLVQVSVSAPNVVLRRQRPGKGDDLQAKGWLRAFRCACWVLRVAAFSLAEMEIEDEVVDPPCGRRQEGLCKGDDAEPRFAASQGWMMGIRKVGE